MAHSATPTPSNSKAPQRSKRPFWLRLLRWGLFVFGGFHVYCVLVLVYLRFLPPAFSTVQLQHRVEAAFGGEWLEVRMLYRPMEAISPHLHHAVVAAEDTRFFEHDGIDFDALEQAMSEKRNSLRGGSTITQQLVKNLFFTTHRSYLRKGMEFTIAPLAELILPKDRILELYINVVEWGKGVYGAEAAARYHYKISSSKLNRNQASRLAACLPAPLTRKPQAMNRYSRIIQKRMRAMGY
ncbi:MAG: monofunctional biosynthetic peptidoglycan transglycosylase [Bacteroidetes Order II. Incertae sedis bacterium]|nr:monofunctional biosynthetic peptidoglycan transglycosylase [Bacteroidetes Order II. bacterium]